MCLVGVGVIIDELIRLEKEMERKKCGNCQCHQEINNACMNSFSDFYQDITDENFYCCQWQPQKGSDSTDDNA